MTTLALIASLFFAAAPAQAPAEPAEPAETWSWCVAEATSPGGAIRYFSDPFEGGADDSIGAVFVEYVRQAYGDRDHIRDVTVSCRTDANLSVSQTNLQAAMKAQPKVRDVPTAWRFHFE